MSTVSPLPGQAASTILAREDGENPIAPLRYNMKTQRR